MKNSNTFDADKRRSLKIISGLTASGLLVSESVLAGLQTGLQTGLPNNISGEEIDCTLIYRADGLRLHLLMHNQSDTNTFASNFQSQPFQFGDKTFNLAKAFSETVIIPPMDRVMIRLNLEALQNLPVTGKVNQLNATTRYLPQGTRVMNFTATIKQGIGTIELANTQFS